MHLALMKTSMGSLVPASDDDAESISGLKTGSVIHADFRQMRNVRFHRKFFAMLKTGFDHWDLPELEHEGLPVQKNFEAFRRDCTIAAGYCHWVLGLDGKSRLEADSIAFGNMDEHTFEQLYSNVANVLLQKVLRNYSRDDLDRVVERILAFT